MALAIQANANVTVDLSELVFADTLVMRDFAMLARRLPQSPICRARSKRAPKMALAALPQRQRAA